VVDNNSPADSETEAVIYLDDTDAVIFIARALKSRRRPSQRQGAEHLVRRCRDAQAAGEVVGLSAVTVSELEFGARLSGQYESERQAVHKVLTPFDIFDYDGVLSPSHYGRIRHELEAKGITISSMDLLIAAHALALEATLVSNNVAHFSRVGGLKTANWLSESKQSK
jgi:tRNA(fMet)-specific endonuclease VapC